MFDGFNIEKLDRWIFSNVFAHFINYDGGLVTRLLDRIHRTQTSRAPTNDTSRIFVGNMTPEEIEAQTKELYQKIDGVWTCLHCGKTTAQQKNNIRFHVETHMDGLCYTCNICNKDFRSQNILKCHKQRSHSKSD